VKLLALILLLVGLCTRFGWMWAPIALQADVWNVSGAVYTALLLGLLAAVFHRSEEMGLVLAYLICLQLVTAGCSIAWLASPWTLVPGKAECDGAFNTPIAMLGLYTGLMVSLAVRSSSRGKNTKS
jgi:hypothetical protein